MVVKHRKKVRRYRGSSTHGGGNRKKRRGAGSRGGRGNAGTGKRSGHMKAGMAPCLGHFSHPGFLPRRCPGKIKTINIGNFTPKAIEDWVAAGKAKKEGNIIHIDLAGLGYDKLLGTGSTALKLKITIDVCSVQAAEKISAAGGEIISSQTAAAADEADESSKIIKADKKVKKEE